MKKRVIFMSMLLTFAIILTSCTGGKGGNKATNKATNNGKAGDSGYKIGWSTIYLTPSWMQQTNALMEERADHWKKEGILADFTVANANGDTSQQIAQIENMISKGYDAIIICAGSSTALNNVINKADAEGVVTINFDSLVTTDKVTSKINTSQVEYGKICAEWLAEEIGGKGDIIIMNGPAGVAVSDERNQGAKEVLKKYPDINVITELNTEYNEGPAMNAVKPVLDANSNLKGILSLGGSQSSAALKAVQEKGMDLIPITGENYNMFLKAWADVKDKGFSSLCVSQPNWLGVLSIDQAIRAIKGDKVEKEVVVPIPQITNDNLSEYVPNDLPDDGFPIKDITQEQIDEILIVK